MAIQEVTVQVNDSDHLSTRVELDGVEFRLDFYVTKSPNLTTGVVTQVWYLDLYDSADNPLVLGIGLATGIDILYPYRALEVPAGKLFVNPTGGVSVDPTVNTFSEDEAVLYYQPEADVEALGVAS